MTGVLELFDALIRALRVVFFAMAAVLAVVTSVDWLVRSRRINPFGKVARFFRQTVDPIFVPVERRVVRAGGNPAAAPWWALGAVIVGGIVMLSLLGFIRSQIFMSTLAVEGGGRAIFHLLLGWTFGILQIAIIVRVICSWIRVSPYSKWVRWAFAISEPILRPLRAIIPSFGMIDITPIIAFFALGLLESFILSIA